MNHEARPNSNHEVRIRQEFFESIESGDKKYEIRVAFSNFTNIKVGDVITFLNGRGRKIEKKVKGVFRHHTIEDCLEGIDENEVAPGHSYEEIISWWQDPNNVNLEKLKELGIVVFELQ